MKRLLIFLMCIVLLVAALLWRAPAWLVADALHGGADDLQLGAVSGSLWQGSFSHVGSSAVVVRPLHWQFRPLAMLQGRPLSIRFDEPAKVTAQLGYRDSTLNVYELLAEGRIASVLAATGIPSMGFDGHFSASAVQAGFTAQGCQQLSGELSIEQLSGDVEGLASLGQIHAVLSCEDGTLTISIDENNPQKLRGSITVDRSGLPRGRMQLSPPAGSELYNSLRQFLGRPRNGSDFILRF